MSQPTRGLDIPMGDGRIGLSWLWKLGERGQVSGGALHTWIGLEAGFWADSSRANKRRAGWVGQAGYPRPVGDRVDMPGRGSGRHLGRNPPLGNGPDLAFPISLIALFCFRWLLTYSLAGFLIQTISFLSFLN
jgi:hypothetical protein